MKQSPEKNNRQQSTIQQKGNGGSFFGSKGGGGTFFGPTVQKKSFFGAAPMQKKASESEEPLQAKFQDNTLIAQAKGANKQVAQASGQNVSANQLPARTVDYEFFAHKVAYDPHLLHQDSTVAQIAINCGYNPYNAITEEGQNSLMMTLVFPQGRYADHLHPILIFRGTDVRAGTSGLLTDLDTKQVGHRQYHHNKRKIADLLARANARVIVTGHSLGGAVAQLVTAHHTGNIAKTVTFQSPGISNAAVDLYNDNANNLRNQGHRAPEVAHHIMTGDAVDKAGQQNIPGAVYQHGFDNTNNPLDAHTSFVTHTNAFAGRRNQIGLTDNVVEGFGKRVRTRGTGITRHNQYPHENTRRATETARRTGGILSGPLRLMEDVNEFGQSLGNLFSR